MPRVFNTIQEAIDDALKNGDAHARIWVGPGVYKEGTIDPKGLEVVGCGPGVDPWEFDYLVDPKWALSIVEDRDSP